MFSSHIEGGACQLGMGRRRSNEPRTAPTGRGIRPGESGHAASQMSARRCVRAPMSWVFYASYVGGWTLLIVYLLSLRSSLRRRDVWPAQPKWRRRALFVLTDLVLIGMVSLAAAPFVVASIPWALSVFAGSSTCAAFFSGSVTRAMQRGWPLRQEHISHVFLPAAPIVGIAALACVAQTWIEIALGKGWIAQ